jgi:hypothetical protein
MYVPSGVLIMKECQFCPTLCLLWLKWSHGFVFILWCDVSCSWIGTCWVIFMFLGWIPFDHSQWSSQCTVEIALAVLYWGFLHLYSSANMACIFLFCYLLIWFVIKVMLVLENEFQRILSCSIFESSLRGIGASPLNMCLNSAMKPLSTGLFFNRKLFIADSVLLSVYLNFLCLHDLALVDCVFPGIYMFLLAFQIS